MRFQTIPSKANIECPVPPLFLSGTLSLSPPLSKYFSIYYRRSQEGTISIISDNQPNVSNGPQGRAKIFDSFVFVFN